MTSGNARGSRRDRLPGRMRRFAVAALLAVLASAARAEDPQVDAAIRALRSDSSLKVRTQAAIVLGQRGAREGLDALREAVEKDGAAAVRIAAVAALAKIGGRSARPTLEAVSRNDGDASVRQAAARALEDLGQIAFSIEEPAGSAGGAAARGALRDALARHLRNRGFAVVDHGGLRLKPSVLRVDVDERGGKTIIAVKASLVAVDSKGRMAAILESGARLSASGTVSSGRIPAYSEKAIDAAARTLCEDLAARLGER